MFYTSIHSLDVLFPHIVQGLVSRESSVHRTFPTPKASSALVPDTVSHRLPCSLFYFMSRRSWFSVLLPWKERRLLCLVCMPYDNVKC